MSSAPSLLDTSEIGGMLIAAAVSINQAIEACEESEGDGEAITELYAAADHVLDATRSALAPPGANDGELTVSDLMAKEVYRTVEMLAAKAQMASRRTLRR